jgi:L-alanine-DL-glutamate epimerase-like enolase superfamily enzyme
MCFNSLVPLLVGADAMALPASWLGMVRSIRNLGRPGIASMAISAVDVALWDLKARLLDVSLLGLLGKIRDHVPVYGSGGLPHIPSNSCKTSSPVGQQPECVGSK